jgi:hypothetical protein
MKYIIEQSEKKTTQTGKPFIKAVLRDERGHVTDNVSIWSDFPDFEALDRGIETRGEILVNARGYRNLKSMEKATHDSSQIRQAAERTQAEPSLRIARLEPSRQDAIKLAQDRKYEAIGYFNAVNSSIALVSALRSKLIGTVNRSVVKQELSYWRDWFLEEWKSYEAQGFESKHKAF